MPIGTTARTGEICPESGVWQVMGTPSTTAPIARGNRMPPYDGKAVTWTLIRLLSLKAASGAEAAFFYFISNQIPDPTNYIDFQCFEYKKAF
ncbi:MAG: hypothetical protein NVV59_08250 [Chitinophagaceae bacterium]|nr:hypothetical protein [Chitinophagaceae bacterium]